MPRARRALSALSWLRWLVVLSAVPAWAAAAWIIATSYAHQRDTIVNSTIGVARVVMRSAERDLAGARATLEVLASSSYLATNDLAQFHRQAREVLQRQPGNGIVLADLGGQQVMSTIVPYGTPLPRSGLPQVVGRIVETGNAVAADFYIGATSKRPQVAVGVPVVRDGKVAYALTMGFLPERLGQLLLIDKLPPGAIVTLLDGNGTVVARTRAAEQFVGQKASPVLLARLAEGGEGTVESRSLEGKHVLAAFSRSPALGWTVVVGIPMEELTGPLRESLWLSAIVAFLLFLVGVYVPRAVSLQVERSIRAELDAARRVEEELKAATQRDALTGLANRLSVETRLREALARTKARGTEVGLLFIDLDRFKEVNDTFGHAAGDALLKEAAVRLRACVRDTDVVARLGGDEFVVLLERSLDRSNATRIAQKALDALTAPVRIDGKEIGVSASIGIAFGNAEVKDTQLLKLADQALYEAKGAGRNCYRIAG